MRLALVSAFVVIAATRYSLATPYARNVAYHSPFESHPQGDPLSTSVLLWTRAAPVSGTSQPDQSVPICVHFAIFDNPTLKGRPLDSGDAFTSWDVDFTVKVDAGNLRPDSWYWYQFSDCTNAKTKSPVGRTRTFASPNTPAHLVNGGKPLKLAVFSCSNYPFGFFNAYRIASENVSADAFIHLGDYYYEYADGVFGNGHAIGRILPPRELATITDYRTRLSIYRTDAGLIEAHQNAPWITVWDDHEVADNTWKAGSTDSNDSVATGGCAFSPSQSCFTDRKSVGVRAYHEWLPIRQVAADDKLRIWRNFRIGKLLDLTMLDTRQYDRDVTDDTWNRQLVASLADQPERSMMGFEQEQWFFDRLTKSKQRGAVWRVVGQQVVFSQVLEGTFFNFDQWDGYRANRQRILDHISQNKIDNVVILSGDSHANWVSDLAFPNDTKTYDPHTGRGALGVEFAGTAVSSPSAFGTSITPSAANIISQELLALNPELMWSEGSFRGFFVLSITAEKMESSFYALSPGDLREYRFKGFVSAKFTVLPGQNRLQRPVAGGTVAAGALKKLGV
ncbi:hypothetical protein EXIGLDRAFT_603419 [Exidia glandulosa HHB12029]|uniref:Alkaline phosphatase n=1 Tax=Exidia glandulosa HHB12029 TaxID=1314781 RepID=A0A165NPL6_EXIGL|nr:hypothetical protein EXIGLDRAFT_603419 [Exidia glandulosa HHB12029]